MQGTAEGAGFIWPGEEGNTIAVFSYQVGVMRRSQTRLGGVQSKRTRGIFCSREVLQGTRGKGKKMCFQRGQSSPGKGCPELYNFHSGRWSRPSTTCLPS